MAKAETAGTAAGEGFQGVFDETGEGFTYDMSNQEEDSGYPILPKGTYSAVIDKAVYKISKSSGNPMWEVTHLVTEAEHADKNLKVFSYVVFKHDGMGRVKSFLAKIGAADLGGAGFNPKQIADDGTLVGKEHRVRLDIRKSEEYGDSNEVKSVLSAGAGTVSGGAGSGSFSM